MLFQIPADERREFVRSGLVPTAVGQTNFDELVALRKQYRDLGLMADEDRRLAEIPASELRDGIAAELARRAEAAATPAAERSTLLDGMVTAPAAPSPKPSPAPVVDDWLCAGTGIIADSEGTVVDHPSELRCSTRTERDRSQLRAEPPALPQAPRPAPRGVQAQTRPSVPPAKEKPRVEPTEFGQILAAKLAAAHAR
jgi:hypothetical protein